ncbi:MAG: SDR family oxidoreductase [Planctomycetes bacterium]|nr:SDR family oxidoreductase [Planctomycetota bacterium]
MSAQSRAVLITGASSGMGAATAVRLARDGARIVLAARRVDRLDAVAEQVRQAGGEALVVPTDTTEYEQVRALVSRTMEAFGRIDVVFNNAGLMRVGPIEKLAIADIDRMVRTNVLGAIYVLKETVPILKRQDCGIIINVSSVLGRKTRATAWVYAATKWAVTAINEGLREELVGTKVRVCAIQPGVVDTELFDAFETHPKKAFSITHPIKPEEVADLLAYIIDRPWHFNVNEVLMRPTQQMV